MRVSPRGRRPVFASVFALLASLTVVAPVRADDVADLEARLLAPCCYVQTLGAHQSPLASQLRAEVRQRLSAGESVAGIEADLVGRYGEKIRAVPSGFGLERYGAGLFVVGLVVAGVTILLVARRLRARPGPTGSHEAATPPDGGGPPMRPEDAALAARLDDELDRLD